MLRSLDSAASGLQQMQQRLDVIGNNIANVNTVGFKASRTELADSFSQTLASATLSGGPSQQVGLGVGTTAVYNLFTQGALTRTNIATDLSIAGDGFFVVRDAISGEEFVTRAGDFHLDNDGYLVTPDGMRVQGYTDPALTTRGDIQIDATQRPATADPAATLSGFSIGSDGQVTLRLSDGTTYTRAQVLTQSFTNPMALVKEGNSLYSGMSAAGPVTADPAMPGTNGLGRLQSGALELSNVDLATEFSNMITTQRGFQANARVITTSDEILQELVNLKR
jgi:flagellar hook protein FlgE